MSRSPIAAPSARGASRCHGNARRQGSIRSPLLEGGGVHFAPRPRDYSYTLPKKMRQMGLKSALSHLYKEGRLHVVDSMTSTDGKTKDMATRLANLKSEKSVLICTEIDDKFKRATQNMKSIRYYPTEAMNVYDLLKFDTAIVTKDSIKAIEKKCGVES